MSSPQLSSLEVINAIYIGRNASKNSLILSVEEAEFGDEWSGLIRLSLPITGDEVTELVKQLLGGQAPGVDDVPPVCFRNLGLGAI